MKKIINFFSNKVKQGPPDNERRNFKLILKKAVTTNIVPKLLCLLAALCLWFYVVDTESTTYEKVFKGVEIEFNKNENGLKVLSSNRVSVDVTLSGKRSVLNRMSNSDISATVDIAHISEAFDEELDIIVSTSNDTSVVSYEPVSVRVYLDEPSSRTISVKADYTGGTSDEETLKIGELVPSSKSVVVKGPLEIISKIAYAKATVNLDGFISHSVNIVNVELELFDSDGALIKDSYPAEYEYIEIGETAEDKRIDVYVPVYMIKELPVVPQYMYGIFESKNINCDIFPGTVTVRGDVSLIEKLTEISTAPIDDTMIGLSRSLQIGYDLPSGVSLSGSDDTCRVTLSVENYDEKEISVPSENVRFMNLADDLDAYVNSDEISITVCGVTSSLRKIGYEELLLEIDVSGFGEGKYFDCPVNVQITDSTVQNVYIKESEYTATVVIRKLNIDD